MDMHGHDPEQALRNAGAHIEVFTPTARKTNRRKKPPAETNDEAPGDVIRIRGGFLHEEATAGAEAIQAAGRPVYQRGASLVRPALQIVPAAHGRTTNSACLVEITGHGLVDQLCGVATWERFDARADEWVRVNPPMAVAQTILSRVGDWPFPRIAGVVTTPTLRPDGSILSEPGYDEATRLYHMADSSIVLHRAAKAPSRADAQKALALLVTLLSEFPFVDRVSQAVALSPSSRPWCGARCRWRRCMPSGPGRPAPAKATWPMWRAPSRPGDPARWLARRRMKPRQKSGWPACCWPDSPSRHWTT